MRVSAHLLTGAATAVLMVCLANSAAAAEPPADTTPPATTQQTTSIAEVAATGAYAADAPKTQGDQAAELQPVIVSARRRQESLQNTPVSVTAITPRQITTLFVENLSDFGRLAPDFTIEGVGAIHRNAAVIFSRGIGYQNVDQAIDPSVGVAVDGVFFTRNIGALSSAFDVDNVEILRGPQGTLFGKNTTGGVVSVTTIPPGHQFDVTAYARLGNFGRADYGFATDIPIASTLSARISFQSTYSDGYVRNTYVTPAGVKPPDQWLSGDNVKSFRGALRWTPTAQLTFDLTVAYIHDRSPSVGGIDGSYPTDLLSILLGHPGFGFPGGPTNPYVTQRDFPSGDYDDTFATTLNSRYEGDGFNIISISGYMRDTNLSYNDFDDSALPFYETTSNQRHEQYSQELRIESASKSPFQWVAGAYISAVDWHAGQIYYLPILSPAAPVLEDGSAQTDTAGAVFAQVDYKIIPKLTLTLGGRYSNEDKSFHRYLEVPISRFAGDVPIPARHDWSDFTYHAGVNYELTDDSMIYASYSTGFKSGGFNSLAASAASIGPFAPEQARAWEVGLKSEYFEHRLRLDVAAFWNNYTDLQVSSFQAVAGGVGQQQVVANNANERADGVEVEFTALPVRGLRINGSVSYLDAVYTSFVANLSGKPASPLNPCGGLINRASEAIPGCYLVPSRTPHWTAHLAASYEFDLDGKGKLTPSVDWSLESQYFTDLTNAPQGLQPTFNMVNASLNYDDPSGRWRVSLWTKNLGNVAEKLSAVPTAGLLTQLYFAAPRTFGVEFRVKLGG